MWAFPKISHNIWRIIYLRVFRKTLTFLELWIIYKTFSWKKIHQTHLFAFFIMWAKRLDILVNTLIIFKIFFKKEILVSSAWLRFKLLQIILFIILKAFKFYLYFRNKGLNLILKFIIIFKKLFKYL